MVRKFVYVFLWLVFVAGPCLTCVWFGVTDKHKSTSTRWIKTREGYWVNRLEAQK